MIDHDFLCKLIELPSVGTACGPVVNLATERFGDDYKRTYEKDGFCLFHKAEATHEDLKVVFVAHMDEVGGCVYGKREDGFFDTRVWGNIPSIFDEAELQGFDWLIEDADSTFPISSQVNEADGEARLIVQGSGIQPFRTGFTFKEKTKIDGDLIEGKALDPRVTLYAVIEAVRALNSPHVGAMLVMAEECAMDVARKGVHYLQMHAPNLELIANADVPGINNLADGQLDLPAIRIFEGRNFIDPSFGIAVSDLLKKEGVEFHLSAARSGSQTLLFTPLASTLSIALPSIGVHLPRVQMSMRGLERCVTLLGAIGDGALNGAFRF